MNTISHAKCTYGSKVSKFCPYVKIRPQILSQLYRVVKFAVTPLVSL
jgi:hypothetical protein